MTYSVSILLRARQDVQQIFDWLAARSEQGAQSWFESFEISVSALSKNPFLAAIAPENDHCEREIRHVLFRTRQGRFYRALFTVVESEVRILRVRGPGEPPVRSKDME
ncbi:MAG: type II toxin-antitoxin system RelE/ParE family toxin [Isosphaeraceae bacterium]|jgi:plasmid stabilization system protein ParE